MTENRPILDQIAKTLVEKEKIDGLELLKIIQDIKPELVPEGSAKKLAEFVGRAKQAVLPEGEATPALQPAAMEKIEQSETYNTAN